MENFMRQKEKCYLDMKRILFTFMASEIVTEESMWSPALK